jgi:hypothetical protein
VAGAAATAAAAASRPQSNIVRVLAPNGQPRKVPASALLAGSGGAGSHLLLSTTPAGRHGSHQGYGYPN